MTYLKMSKQYGESTWIESKLPCEACGSSDAYHISENDGIQYGHCFTCQHHERLDGNINEAEPMKDKQTVDYGDALNKIQSFQSITLKDRKINSGVTGKYGVVSFLGSKVEEISRYYPIYSEGKLVAYKERKLPKEFRIVGSSRGNIELFGQRLWTNGGKLLIITVGEEDAMASYQITSKFSKSGKGYSSVSVVNGANATKNIKSNLEWIEKFDKVIFAVDQEELDLSQAEKWCDLITIGKGHIAKFEGKDASDMLKLGKEEEYMDALRNARKHIGEGTVFSGLSFSSFHEQSAEIDCVSYPTILGLDDLLPGFVKGKTDILVAPVKTGKTTIVNHFIYELIKQGEKVALFSTEISAKNILKKLMSLHLETNLRTEGSENLKKHADSYKELFGSDDSDSSLIIDTCESIMTVDDVTRRARQYALGYDVKYIFVDNLTGFYKKLADEGKELHVANKLALELTNFAKTYEIYTCLVLHTRKKMESANSKYQSDITIDSVYGSGDAVRWCDNVIAITKAEHKDEGQDGFITQLRVLASRDNRTGSGNKLQYNPKTTKYEKLNLEVDTEMETCYNIKSNNIL